MQMEILKAEGNTHFKHKRYRNAIQSYEAALELNPSNAKLHGNLSLCFLKLSNIDSAKSHAKLATEIDPHWAKGWARLSQAYEASDFPLAFALDAIKKAASLNSVFDPERQRIQKKLNESYTTNKNSLMQDMFNAVDVASKGYISEKEYTRMMNICLGRFDFTHDYGWRGQGLTDKMKFDDFEKFILDMGREGRYLMAEFMQFQEPTYKFDAALAILSSTPMNEALCLTIYDFMREYWGFTYASNFQFEWERMDGCDLSEVGNKSWILQFMAYEIHGKFPMISVGVEVEGKFIKVGATCVPVMQPAGVELWLKFFKQAISLFGLKIENFEDVHCVVRTDKFDVDFGAVMRMARAKWKTR